MTTLTNRPNTALAVIDVQVGVVTGAHERDQVVANIATLVDKARAAGTPVLWVLHSHPEYLPVDSDGWQLVPELSIADGERVVHKTYADSFEETDLEAALGDLGVGRLVVSGAQTDECIRSTLHGALVRGYDATLVSDAHTTEDQSSYGAPTPDLVVAHTNLYWQHHRAPGREAGIVATAEVDFTSPAAAS
jgi:nicotinamidase-related amidase